MKTLTATFRIVTPLFLAGTDQEGAAEIRLPSIKGALRFWYRTIDPEYRKREAVLFGGTGSGEGQARFLMRLIGEQPEKQMGSETLLDPRKNRQILQGLQYLLFPLRRAKRNGLLPDQTFTVQFLVKPLQKRTEREQEQEWKGLLASVWLLGHLGGLGFRSRRGFGTVALESWEVAGDEQAAALLERLPPVHGASTPEEWMERFQAGLSEIGSWYSEWQSVSHTLLGTSARFFLGGHLSNGWEGALADGSVALSEFRKNHRQARLALGLPMIVFYPRNRRQVTYQRGSDKRDTRMGSPVFFRVVRIGSKFVPMFAALDAPLPEVTLVKKDKREDGDGRQTSPPICIPSNWKEYFADHLTASGYREIGREVNA